MAWVTIRIGLSIWVKVDVRVGIKFMFGVRVRVGTRFDLTLGLNLC